MIIGYAIQKTQEEPVDYQKITLRRLIRMNPIGKKECRTCGEIKEINGNFTYKDKARGTYMLDCNSCRAKIATAKYQANKEKTNTDATL